MQMSLMAETIRIAVLGVPSVGKTGEYDQCNNVSMIIVGVVFFMRETG